METCKDCEWYEAYSGTALTECGNVVVMICHGDKYPKKYASGTNLCCEGGFTPKKPKVEKTYKVENIIKMLTPKPKENKMNRLKKLIRRYVMGCTLYCTVIICIAVNPWVCKLWQFIWPQSIKWMKDGDSVDRIVGVIFLPWLFTITSIAAIVIAIYAFNKATAFVFGKLGK